MLKYEHIISKMTLLEKASLMSGKDFWTTVDIKRLNIPSIFLSDGPHGLRKQASGSDNLGLNASLPATCFPTAATIANSWDVDLGKMIGNTLGIEARKQNINVLLGPGVNIKRSPLCGRNFEYFSEDPFLAGKIASSYIKGIQEKGVASCIKHFACNNEEINRQTLDSIVDERTFREIYLRQFEIAIKEANPKCIMSSYNLINGSYANENKHLLVDILRNEWNYKGVVVTDWGANNDRVEGLKCYNELEMPSSNGETPKDIIKAIQQGIIDEKLLDENVNNLLELIFDTYKEEKETDGFDIEAHHQLALKAAEESIVLLKNDGILPLDTNKKIAFIGDFIFSPRYQGAGSSIVNPTKLDKHNDIIKNEFNNISGIVRGFDRYGKKKNKLLKEAINVSKKADVIVCYLGLDEVTEAEGLDRENMKIKDNQIRLIDNLKQLNKPIVIVLSAGSSIELPFKDDVNAIVHSYLGGQALAKAITNVLKGVVNPSGKLAESYPFKYEDVSCYNSFPSKNHVALYKEGLYVGYRYFDKNDISVAYPFGYGLSYTTFEYSNLKINDKGVSFVITNTGKYKGKEIAQLYIGKKETKIIRPKKELKGFVKIELNPNESNEVFIQFDEHSFTHFNLSTNKYEIEGGQYEIYIGASSLDIRLNGTINKLATTDNIDDNTNMREYMSGDVNDISEEQFEQLLGNKIPSGDLVFINKRKTRINVNYNTTVIELKYARGWLGRALAILIKIVIKFAATFGDKAWANTMIMGVMYQPMRGISRMTGGMISWAQLDGLIDAFNGHFFRGIKAFIKDGKIRKKVKKKEEKEKKNQIKIDKRETKKALKKAKKDRKNALKSLSKDERKAFLENERKEAINKFEQSEKEYSLKIIDKKKTLIEQNKSLFFFKLSQLSFFQYFRRSWNKYTYLHPMGSKWIYEIVFFFTFSIGVTLWQYLVMLFLPYAFAPLAGIEFVWPNVNYTWFDGATLTWGIFNEPVKIDTTTGLVSIGGGLGNFIAFEIAVFTAQCINFPLQRNITFKSHGNPLWQAMWYFIGWILISLGVNALWGFINPILIHYLGHIENIKAFTDLLKTFITGFVSMVIFFFIFKIIFKDKQKKN